MSRLTLLLGCLALLLLGSCAGPRPASDPQAHSTYVADLLASRPDRFGALLADPGAHRLQILVTKFSTNEAGQPSLERHGYRLGTEYFYPASSIKLCAAIAAFERLNELTEPAEQSFDEDSALVFHPLFEGDAEERFDASNLALGVPTLRHLVRRVCIVSDNPAFNRLYDFVGQQELNERMWKAGMPSTRIAHRLSILQAREQSRRTPRVDLLAGARALTLPARTSALELDNAGQDGLRVGVAQMRDGKRIDEPIDFRFKNSMSVLDLQNMLLKVVRRDVELPGRPLRLSDRQFELLQTALAQYPGESENPKYDRKSYPDDWVKFLLPGLERVLPKERWRIQNKVGRAYGFSIENAYVEDRSSGRAFAITAVLYTNSDGVLNDDAYEYDKIADPFFADLAELVARDVLGAP
ncbi:MAG: serine hydrolase [Planctomycetes bacterium]|nr:serine hydrolase [Planctomycetota bacterium]